MKTPLILLATTLLIAGCSSTSSDFDTANNTIQEELINQTQEEYLKSVQEEIRANLDINEKALKDLNIKHCQEHSVQELQNTCEYQVIMVMSATGDKSLCDRMPTQSDVDFCNNGSNNQNIQP